MKALKDLKIKEYKHKDWIVEYRPSLGWCYFKKGDKTCIVIYLPQDEKEKVFKIINHDKRTDQKTN